MGVSILGCGTCEHLGQCDNSLQYVWIRCFDLLRLHAGFVGFIILLKQEACNPLVRENVKNRPENFINFFNYLRYKINQIERPREYLHPENR